jgi:hypothetical protein
VPRRGRPGGSDGLVRWEAYVFAYLASPVDRSPPLRSRQRPCLPRRPRFVQLIADTTHTRQGRARVDLLSITADSLTEPVASSYCREGVSHQSCPYGWPPCGTSPRCRKVAWQITHHKLFVAHALSHGLTRQDPHDNHSHTSAAALPISDRS